MIGFRLAPTAYVMLVVACGNTEGDTDQASAERGDASRTEPASDVQAVSPTSPSVADASSPEPDTGPPSNESECIVDSDCVVALDNRRCCACPEVMPRSVVDADECLESPPPSGSGWSCANCTTVRCAACPDTPPEPRCVESAGGAAGVCIAAHPSDVVYAADMYNPINSGESVMVTRADFQSNTCTALDLFFLVGAAPAADLRGLRIRQGAANCCPWEVANDFWDCTSNDGGCGGWVYMTQGSGEVECPIPAVPGIPCKLNVEYTAEFPAEPSWLPPVVHFSVTDLPIGGDCGL